MRNRNVAVGHKINTNPSGDSLLMMASLSGRLILCHQAPAKSQLKQLNTQSDVRIRYLVTDPLGQGKTKERTAN